MRKLKLTGVLRAVFLVLTVTGILLFFLLTAMDRRKLQCTVDNTIAFARARIQRYEDFNTNDKVKSLIRLLDKSTELSRVIAAEGIPDQEKLDRYVEDQRLSGVLILDENMRVVLQNSQNGDTMPIWENQISGAYVRDILKHPELAILAESDEAGVFLVMSRDGRQIFVQGHPEYDRMTLNNEYHRDLNKGLNPEVPYNYYEDNDPFSAPPLTWRNTSNTLYTNWLNYYVYQVTPYLLDAEE